MARQQRGWGVAIQACCSKENLSAGQSMWVHLASISLVLSSVKYPRDTLHYPNKHTVSYILFLPPPWPRTWSGLWSLGVLSVDPELMDWNPPNATGDCNKCFAQIEKIKTWKRSNNGFQSSCSSDRGTRYFFFNSADSTLKSPCCLRCLSNTSVAAQ